MSLNMMSSGGVGKGWMLRVGAVGMGVCVVVGGLALAVMGGSTEMVALPRYIAIGGGLKADNARVLGSLVNKETKGKVVIVPFASGDQAGAAKNAIELLKAGAPDARFIVLPDPLKDAESRDLAIAWIPTADLVYFTGGDQSRITKRFLTDGKPNALLSALHDGMLRNGTPVAGTSAGAAVLCDPMFTGGGSDAALGLPGAAPEVDADDSDAQVMEPPAGAGPTGTSAPGKEGTGAEAKGAAKPVVGPRLGPGLGLVRNVLLDTHFFSRGRLGRLVAAVEKHPSKVGIGLADNRAVLIAGSNFTAMGDAACLVVNGRAARREGLDRLNVRVTLLNDHDMMRFWPRYGEEAGAPAGEVDREPVFGTLMAQVDRVPEAIGLIPAVKSPAAADGAGDAKVKAPAAEGAWDRGVVLAMLYRLAADPATAQVCSSEKFTITLSADEKTQFYADKEKVSRVTIVNARLDVREKKP